MFPSRKFLKSLIRKQPQELLLVIGTGVSAAVAPGIPALSSWRSCIEAVIEAAEQLEVLHPGDVAEFRRKVTKDRDLLVVAHDLIRKMSPVSLPERVGSACGGSGPAGSVSVPPSPGSGGGGQGRSTLVGSWFRWGGGEAPSRGGWSAGLSTLGILWRDGSDQAAVPCPLVLGHGAVELGTCYLSLLRQFPAPSRALGCRQSGRPRPGHLQRVPCADAAVSIAATVPPSVSCLFAGLLSASPRAGTPLRGASRAAAEHVLSLCPAAAHGRHEAKLLPGLPDGGV